MMPAFMSFPIRIFLTAVLVCSALSLPPVVADAAAAPVPRILLLNSYNYGYDWSDAEIQGFKSALSRSYIRYELFIEHLDTKKFYGKSHFPRQADLLEAKYSNSRLDVVIAMDNAALEFISQYRNRLFPGLPVVFCGINDYVPSMIAGQQRITGVAEYHDSAGTLALALKLHPETREVVVIHDYTDTGIAMRHELASAAGRHSTVKIRYMEEMPLEQTVEKLKLLAPGSLVLMLSYTVEKGGRTFTQAEAAQLVSSASPVPVYGLHAEQLGSGLVGGRMMEGEIQGEKAAELAVRIMSGTDPANLPVITSNLSHPKFDYRVMHKFGIELDKLPSDAMVINKPPPTYAVSKSVFWIVSVFTVISFVGILILIRNVRQRKGLESSLRVQIIEYQETLRKLEETDEQLRRKVDDYQLIHGQLLATEDKLRIQLQAVEANEQKFRTLFESMHEGFALNDLVASPDGTVLDYRVLMVNRSYSKLTGISAETAQGALGSELYGSMPPPHLDEYLCVALTGEPLTFETYFPATNRYFHVSAVCPASGQFAVVFEDVTEYKRISRFQRAVLDDAVYAIITTSADGVITSINPAAERLLGYTAEELIGIHKPNVFHLKEEVDAWAAELSSRYQETITGFEAFVAPSLHGDVNQHDWTYVRKDGSHVAVRLDVTVMHDETGRTLGFLGFASDITEQRQLEAQIRQQQKMESIGLLAGGIAHDFNNMLAPIFVYSEMIRKKFPEDDPVFKRASAILEAAGKANDLVRQLLSFSRKQILATRLHDLNEIISSFGDILQRTIRESVVIRQALCTAPCPVKADRTQIEQVLLNLAVNAQDAITGNGVITIETGHVMLDDEYCQLHPGARPGRFTMLTVTDSGSGMDEATMQHIFEPFFSTKAVGKGTGLGLSTVYGIVKQHDGYIEVKSRPGEGTIFRIYLPRAAEPESEKALPALGESTSTPLGNATILLVEDNEMVMEMTRELLENFGCTVLSAYLPEDAIAIARENLGNISLLLTDVVMPQMNGPELHGRLRELMPDLPVLYMSGYAGNVVVANGSLEEEAICITKPFTAETLLDGVAKMLS